ncbi:DnaD domain protein [Peribacillus cavernae]|uniref:DnaD domain protein n=1 Tax=Peribacillus cavernae TaxID=1674310 RepID=A0A3S0U1U4_9BACI|nr:DnaD domain-containing protein [Peribacillus cavernae]MDQ0218954.1 DNA replication protein [Peribacillus cavernae]RUQ29338.1 DnaD domain protein [Peribacillus cavernae]
MIKNKIFAWLKEGTITIPSFLFSNYKAMGLNEQEVMLLLQLQSFLEMGNAFPTPSQMAARMTFQESECLFMIQRLIQKGFIDIEEEYSNSIRHERYSIDPLYEKMIDCFLKTLNQTESAQAAADNDSLYTIFEKEFGRPLSPFECETLAMWMEEDHHPDIIKAALRESVISGKLNFRYIDRILFEWKKNGVKTLEQAKSHGEKFRVHQKRDKKAGPAAAAKEVPFYNWLEQ